MKKCFFIIIALLLGFISEAGIIRTGIVIPGGIIYDETGIINKSEIEKALKPFTTKGLEVLVSLSNATFQNYDQAVNYFKDVETRVIKNGVSKYLRLHATTDGKWIVIATGEYFEKTELKNKEIKGVIENIIRREIVAKYYSQGYKNALFFAYEKLYPTPIKAILIIYLFLILCFVAGGIILWRTRNQYKIMYLKDQIIYIADYLTLILNCLQEFKQRDIISTNWYNKGGRKSQLNDAFETLITVIYNGIEASYKQLLYITKFPTNLDFDGLIGRKNAFLSLLYDVVGEANLKLSNEQIIEKLRFSNEIPNDLKALIYRIITSINSASNEMIEYNFVLSFPPFDKTGIIGYIFQIQDLFHKLKAEKEKININ